MMRVLLAVGCDSYENLPLSPLSGAENDASAIFGHLVTMNGGGYDKDRSRILLSPSIAALRSAVENVLFSGEFVEEFTFFFAGHGGVKDGTYFLCLKDTDVDRMSMSALSMPQLFAWLTEAKVGHTNLIIDACQSGGVVHDIGILLNPSVIGKVGSLALSILAASGSNEYAQETNGAGLCTTVLLSCLKGDIIVQTTRPSLDLVEVGQVVSRTLQGKLQTPVCWGINLFGISQLAKNPRYTGGNGHITETLSGLTTNAAANEYIRAASDNIWELYLSLSREFDAERFLDVIQPICAHFNSEPDIAVAFVRGLAGTFAVRAEVTLGPFDVARLYAACAVALLPLAGSSAACDDVICELAEKTVHSIELGIRDLYGELQVDKYALLSFDSAAADFFFLPLRVMSILGWIGAACHLAALMGQPDLLSAEKAAEVVRLIMTHYATSIVPVSDEITPFFLTFATAAEYLGCAEEREVVSCILLRILFDREGRLAVSGLNGEEALRFLDAITTEDHQSSRDLLANPTTLIPALLLVFNAMGLADLANGAMRRFDHTNMNIFIPADFSTFGDRLIEEGTNFSFKVGHTIFSVEDLVIQWHSVETKMASSTSRVSAAVAIASILASLLRPDREAWFLLAAGWSGSGGRGTVEPSPEGDP